MILRAESMAPIALGLRGIIHTFVNIYAKFEHSPETWSKVPSRLGAQSSSKLLSVSPFFVSSPPFEPLVSDTPAAKLDCEKENRL